MYQAILNTYETIVLKRPVLILFLSLLLIGAIGYFAKDFRLDASADSLILENDADLKYYRSVTANYGSDDFLIISFTPDKDLFAPETLDLLRKLRDELLQIDRVASVVSILDVPLIDSPRLTLGELSNGVRTLSVGQLIDVASDNSTLCTSQEATGVLQQLGIKVDIKDGEWLVFISSRSEWVATALADTIYGRGFGVVMLGLDGVYKTDRVVRFTRGHVARAIVVPVSGLDED